MYYNILYYISKYECFQAILSFSQTFTMQIIKWKNTNSMSFKSIKTLMFFSKDYFITKMENIFTFSNCVIDALESYLFLK